jgi:hypothetical protein
LHYWLYRSIFAAAMNRSVCAGKPAACFYQQADAIYTRLGQSLSKQFHDLNPGLIDHEKPNDMTVLQPFTGFCY